MDTPAGVLRLQFGKHRVEAPPPGPCAAAPCCVAGLSCSAVFLGLSFLVPENIEN